MATQKDGYRKIDNNFVDSSYPRWRDSVSTHRILTRSRMCKRYALMSVGLTVTDTHETACFESPLATLSDKG